MLVYLGTGTNAPGVSTTGWAYGNFKQFLLQAEAAGFIIVVNAIGTYVILKVMSLFVSLRMVDSTLQSGDSAAHGEEAYSPV
jgi:Amt family ammonium transporter